VGIAAQATVADVVAGLIILVARPLRQDTSSSFEQPRSPGTHTAGKLARSRRPTPTCEQERKRSGAQQLDADQRRDAPAAVTRCLPAGQLVACCMERCVKLGSLDVPYFRTAGGAHGEGASGTNGRHQRSVQYDGIGGHRSGAVDPGTRPGRRARTAGHRWLKAITETGVLRARQTGTACDCNRARATSPPAIDAVCSGYRETRLLS